MPTIRVEEALRLFREHMPDFGCEKTQLPLSDCVLLEDLVADRDYPPFDRVMMDGIAVSFAHYQEGRREFSVRGVAAAGEPQKKLTDPSSCLEIMTGAPLPEGADLVIPYEHIRIEEGSAKIIQDSNPTHYENVHRKGSDARQGDVLLGKGQFLNGPHWGIAASVGRSTLLTKKKPRINIISTGDELVSVDSVPEQHQIRRSNAYALQVSLKLFGHDEVELSHLADEPAAIEEHYQQASMNFDLLIYSGGVSKGKFDYLPSCWSRMGVQEIFHGISQRPGKPLWFGRDEKTNTTVLGLPGNPVSSLVCLHRYFLGGKEIFAELTEEIVFKKDLTYFVPVKLEFTRSGKILAHPLRIKNSGEFTALAGSDGFLELPQAPSHFRAGETFRFHSWRPL